MLRGHGFKMNLLDTQREGDPPLNIIRILKDTSFSRYIQIDMKNNTF